MGSIRVITGGALLLSGAGALVMAAPRAGTLKPATVLAQLRRDEARLTSGRLSLKLVHREAMLESGEPVARAAARGAIRTQRRESMLFSAVGWKRDITMMEPDGNPTARFQVGVLNEMGRLLQERGSGEQTERSAVLGITPDQEPLHLLLAGRGSTLLQGAKWTTARRQGDRAHLTGSRGPERLELVVRLRPRAAFERLTNTRLMAGPQGQVTRTEELSVVYAVQGGTLAPRSARHLQALSPPGGRSMLVECAVEGAQLNTRVAAHELEIEFPRGTPVSDQRVDPPARYAQTDHELSLAEVRSLGRQQEASRASVGRAAPGFTLPTLDGKSVRLEDYRGKVVLLTWFASW